MLSRVWIRILAGAAAVALTASIPAAQALFDVASIKQADPTARPGRAAAAMGARIAVTPGTISSRSATLQDLVAFAFGLQAYQIVGGPAWIDVERFEVQAKSATPVSKDRMLLMLQKLLIDRFGLHEHRETRQMQVYALTVAVSGKLAPSLRVEEQKSPLNRLGHGWDMPTLARFLTGSGAKLPVIDQTGLGGSFNLDLDVSKAAAATPVSDDAPSVDRLNENLFAGLVDLLERQCGLKLRRITAPIEVLVIDRAERPSPN